MIDEMLGPSFLDLRAYEYLAIKPCPCILPWTLSIATPGTCDDLNTHTGRLLVIVIEEHPYSSFAERSPTTPISANDGMEAPEI